MNKKAQITLEASILIAIVAAGLLAIQAYLRRSIQGNWKSNVGNLSEEQYNPKDADEILPDRGESVVSPDSGEIRFIAPVLNIDVTGDGHPELTKNCAENKAEADSGILQVPGWGVYSK